MKVKQLIAKLKKVPQNLEVAVSAHDNAEWEASGWPETVNHVVKAEFEERGWGIEQKEMYRNMPDEYVVIGC